MLHTASPALCLQGLASQLDVCSPCIASEKAAYWRQVAPCVAVLQANAARVAAQVLECMNVSAYGCSSREIPMLVGKGKTKTRRTLRNQPFLLHARYNIIGQQHNGAPPRSYKHSQSTG